VYHLKIKSVIPQPARKMDDALRKAVIDGG
jgi:hypothetical protein